MNSPRVVALHHHRQSRTLEVRFVDDAAAYTLPCEYLRVFSPSAEVRGHGLAEPMLVGGKREVNIAAIEPVGNYAVRLRFTDGHDTGLYSWDVLHALAREHDANWARYLQRLAEVGMSRDSEVVKLAALQPRKYVPPGT